MARYAIAWSVAGVSNSALAWMRTTAGKDLRLWEAGVYRSSGVAAATDVGFGRPAAVSVTPTTITPQAEDASAGAAVCTAQIAATTKPTSPTLFMRRYGIGATLGAGVIWTWPLGLVVPSGPAECVIWNIGASTDTYAGYFVYDE